MSCVIGLKQKKTVWLACDGVASTEDGEIRPIVAIKLFKKGPYLMGFAGSIRTGQIIQYGKFTIPKSIWGWPDIIREQITEKGAMGQGEDQVQMQGCNFIIGHGSNLYEILSDFQINEIDHRGYTAIGAGSTIAMGSLFTSTGFSMTAEERLRMALHAATEFVGSCGPPYKVTKVGKR